MIEVMAPLVKFRRNILQRDEFAELLAHAFGAQDRLLLMASRRHGFPREISVPQIPAGKNSTQTMKMAPTINLPVHGPERDEVFQQQEGRGADHRPEERSHAAQQRNHHDDARGIVVQDFDRHDRQVQGRQRAGQTAKPARQDERDQPRHRTS